MDRAKWARRKLEESAEEMRTEPEGGRNHTLNRLAFNMRPYISDGVITEDEVTTTLTAAAIANASGHPMRHDEIKKTIESAMTAQYHGEAWYPDKNPSTPGPRKTERPPIFDLSPDEVILHGDVKVHDVELPVKTFSWDETIRLTHYRHGYDQYGQRVWLSFRDLEQKARKPRTWPNKDDFQTAKFAVPLLSGHENENDQRARIEGRSPRFHGMHILFLDYDSDPDFSPAWACSAWWSEVNCISYTTASHTKDEPRGRVIVALSRRVEPEEWPLLREWLIQSGRGNMAKRELANTNLAYFEPVKPPLGEYECAVNKVKNGGAAIDVDALLKAMRDKVEDAKNDSHEADPRVDIPRTSKGKIARISRAVMTILSEDRRWKGRLKYNELSGIREIDGEAIQAHHYTAALIWIGDVYDFEPPQKNVADTMDLICRENPYHPIRDYLNKLRWDGRSRIDTMLTSHFGAEDTPLVREFSRRFMIGASARALDPGCKFDNMLILKGGQGLGKSMSISALFGDEFTGEGTLKMSQAKEAGEMIEGKWCWEVAELGGTGGSIQNVKAFLSKRNDRFRAAYAKQVADRPRQTVFIGTTNDREFLRDRTGERRFWVVEVHGKTDVMGINKHRDQLWAEAAHLYRRGEKHWLSSKFEKLLANVNAKYQTEDPWEQKSLALAAEHWRRSNGAGINASIILDILLGGNAANADNNKLARVKDILSSAGWKEKRTRHPNGSRPRMWFPPDNVACVNEAETTPTLNRPPGG